MLKWLRRLVVMGLVLLSLGTVAAKPPDEIDKIVFVHYPQGEVLYWAPPNAPEPTDENTRYKYTGFHWPSSSLPVGYWINPSGAPSGSETAVIAAFQTWEDEEASAMGFTYLGTTASSGTVFSDGNIVSWQDTSEIYPGAIAVTIVWYYRAGKVIVEVDTIMNSGYTWSVNNCTDLKCDTAASVSSYDVQNIMTHEAGHWLMLEDLYQWPPQKLTMYGYSVEGELQKRTLGAGDKLGIDRIY